MVPGYVRYGWSTVDSTFNVFLSDLDGADILEEFKDEVVRIKNDKSLWYTPITVYIATGIIGFLSVEQVIVYVYNGVPYILSSQASIDGSDEYDGHFKMNGEKMIGRLFDLNNNTIYSLGTIPPHTNVMRYASKYVKTTPLMNDVDIDSTIGNVIITNNNIKSNGTIFSPGGHRYDVFTVDDTVSSAIRGNKDYRYNPTADITPTNDNRQEVLLRGGIPDIVPIGTLTSLNGCFFNVWIPNDVTYYDLAVEMLQQDYIPKDIFTIDDENMIDSYALFAVRANELDASNDLGDDEDEDDEESTES